MDGHSLYLNKAMLSPVKSIAFFMAKHCFFSVKTLLLFSQNIAAFEEEHCRFLPIAIDPFSERKIPPAKSRYLGRGKYPFILLKQSDFPARIIFYLSSRASSRVGVFCWFLFGRVNAELVILHLICLFVSLFWPIFG